MARNPKAITLAPTALDANGISAVATYTAADLHVLLNGALASGLDRDAIAASQTPTDTTALTLTAGIIYPSGTFVSIYGGSDESGKTFTVRGLGADQQPAIEVITGPNAVTVVGTTVFTKIDSITPSGATAGAIEAGINGTVTFTQAQHVTLTNSTNDESGKTFTVLGTDRYERALTETITGPNNNTVVGEKNFLTITSVTVSAATTGGVQVGVDGSCESQWYMLNTYGNNFSVGIGCEISSGGGMTYAIEHTFDNIQATGFAENDATVHVHDTLTAETTNQDGNYAAPPVAMRADISAFTSGTLTTRIVQAR